MKAFPLEPIEKASVDELRSLQLKRLKSALRHAWQNAPAYRRKFDSAGAELWTFRSSTRVNGPM